MKPGRKAGGLPCQSVASDDRVSRPPHLPPVTGSAGLLQHLIGTLMPLPARGEGKRGGERAGIL